MARKGNPNWKKGISGNPKGRTKGSKNADSINESIRRAVEKAAKAKKKTVGEYLWRMALKDKRLMAKLVDKFISDMPRDVNLGTTGAQFVVVTKGKVKW